MLYTFVAMAVNLKKNEKALLDAYNDVLNDKSSTKWAVFGYVGNSNDLKVVETGDGDLEEMVEELSGGKVMYAFIQVTDPNTQLPKNVLVNWAGEGVPPKQKGAYARHTPDVARFLRGAHVTINARSEMDLDEDEVLKKVSTASGAKFSVHKEKARPMPAAAPVGSVYKKANPSINTQARDEFWSKAEQDEERRRTDEKRTTAEQRKREEQERREREVKEGSQRDKTAQERARRIDEQKRQEAAAVKREREEQEAAMQARLKQRESEVDAERQREQRERQQRTNIAPTNVRGKMSAFEEKAAEQTRPPPARPAKRAVKPPPVATREPSPPREPTPPPREPTPPPREPTPPPREPTPEPEPEDDWGDEPEQPMYDDVENVQQTEEYPEQPQDDQYASVDDYPAEPEQPLYDDVDQQPEPEPEPEPENYSYDDQEPDQPMYDDVQGAEDQAGGGEVSLPGFIISYPCRT